LFRAADYDTGYYLVERKLGQLAVKLDDEDGEEQYRVEVSNRFAALEEM
jgi:hypothetical protein